MLKNPLQNPWYADYRLRFEAVRANGNRVTNETTIRGLSEAETTKTLRELLGPGRYDIAFLGITEVPLAEWPMIARLGCGLDKNGKKAVSGTVQGSSAAPAGVGGAGLAPGKK